MRKIISSVLFSLFLVYPSSFLFCQDFFDNPNPMESTDDFDDDSDFSYDLDLDEAESSYFSQEMESTDDTAPAPSTDYSYTEETKSSSAAPVEQETTAATDAGISTESYVEIVNTLDAVAIREDSLLLILSGNPEYNIFALSKPERLVIDFSNTEYSIKKGVIPVSNPFVERVRGSQFKKDPVKVTRMVVDLKKSGIDYEVTKEDEVIVLSFFKPKSRK